MGEAYITRIELNNFKGFKHYVLKPKKGLNVLAGTNNAGKSTLLSAMRLLSAAVRIMKRARPKVMVDAGNFKGSGWRLTKQAFEDAAIEVDNLYHDFDDSQPVSISAQSSDGSSVTIYWPSGNQHELPSLYYQVRKKGVRTTNSYSVFKRGFPMLGAIPVLTPLDAREPQREYSTCKPKFGSKVSSRYFRNALRFLSEEDFQDFSNFLESYTPEVSHLREEAVSFDDTGSRVYLNFFYDEKDDRHPRELRWAGDGFQIWIQLLFHIWSRRNDDIIILDEPDVFLHPDLLARLSRLIQIECGGQVLVATHSVEFISSVSKDDIIWIDRNETTAIPIRRSRDIAEVLEPLGSGFYFTMNRALRQDCILFVEGSSDFDLIRAFARVLNLSYLSRGIGFSVVNLEGIENRIRAEHFRKVAVELGRDVKIFVLLDGDGRTESQNAKLLDVFDLSSKQLQCHIWARRDFESYLLSPNVLCSLSGADLGEYRSYFESYCRSVEGDVRAWLYSSTISFAQVTERKPLDRADMNCISRNIESQFDEWWDSPEGRLSLIDPKDYMRCFRNDFSLNCSNVEIVDAFGRADVSYEVSSFLHMIESALRA